MNLSKVLSVNAFLFIAVGIAFTLFAPNALAYFGTGLLPGDNVLYYWNVVAFGRMFGAILLTLGLVLWGLRGFFAETINAGQARREVLFSLVFGFIIITIAAITQQASVWGSLTGWLVSGLFAVFGLVYIYFLAKKES
jgi:hypothetical protein